MAELTTIPEVMEALGGYRAVAALTGRKPNAAWMWKTFPAFPSDSYLVMQDALEKAGHVAPAGLWGMVPPAPSPAQTATSEPAE